MKRLFLALLAGAALHVAPAAAEIIPAPGPGDPRIRVVRYDPDEVVALSGQLGFQFTIEFSDEERVENVSIGDALGWQVTPNSRASLLFLKPVAQAPTTNLTVVTNLRRYFFTLSSPSNAPGDPKTAIMSLRFLYPAPPAPPPEPPPPPREPPRVANADYSYEGSIKTLPGRVFDDGVATYLQFGALEDYPAIFAVDADGAEAVVNFALRDDYLIVDQVARGFVLRQGSEVTRLFNEGFREKVPGPLSPRPREKPKNRSFWSRK